MSHLEGGQDQQVNYFWHLPSPFQYFRQKQPPALPEQREPFAAAPVPMKDVFVPGVGDLLGALWHSEMIPGLCLPRVFGPALGKHFTVNTM